MCLFNHVNVKKFSPPAQSPTRTPQPGPENASCGGGIVAALQGHLFVSGCSVHNGCVSLLAHRLRRPYAETPVKISATLIDIPSPSSAVPCVPRRAEPPQGPKHPSPPTPSLALSLAAAPAPTLLVSWWFATLRSFCLGFCWGFPPFPPPDNAQVSLRYPSPVIIHIHLSTLHDNDFYNTMVFSFSFSFSFPSQKLATPSAM